MDISIITTQKKRKAIMYKGVKLVLENETVNKTFWQCFKSFCCGRLTTDKGNTEIYA